MSESDKKVEGGAVATEKQNAKLEHSEGGRHTRDDGHDLGVPMLPGDPSEPVGPEDALGEGPTRGDYSQRIGPENYHPHESVPNGDGTTTMVAQRSRVKQGEVAGKKGGVETSEESA